VLVFRRVLSRFGRFFFFFFFESLSVFHKYKH